MKRNSSRRIGSAMILLAGTIAGSPFGIAQDKTSTPSNVPALPADIPADADWYSFFLAGPLAGHQAAWKTPDGKLHVFFEFNDRGRGPKTTSVLTLDKDGIPVAEEITGNNYLKAEVSEHFSLTEGTARWRNSAEKGVKKLAGNAFYVAMDGAPEERALLIRAALKNGGKIQLLPEGEAGVRQVAEREVESGGKKMRAVLYEMTGLGFSPDYLWLEGSGDLFASVSGWAGVIREGWESAQKALMDAQQEIAQKRGADLAKELMHRPKNGIVFTHANVFDADTGKTLSDQSVTIAGNRIRSVEPTRTSGVAADAEVIDAKGKTLIPGLWDMHAHVHGNDGMLNLAAGVTTVRDLANDTDALLARRKRIEQGTEIGTRIIMAGFIDSPGPYQGPTKVLVSTEAEARQAVDNYAKLGYVQIKIYSSVKPELVPAIIDEAHKNGLRVSGHIPAEMIASECVRLGFNEIQHVNFLVLNFFPEVKDTQTRARLVEPMKRAADLDLDSAAMKEFVQLLKDRHVSIDPTMSIFEDSAERPGQIPAGYAAVFDRLPAQVRRELLGGGLPVPEGMEQRYRESFRKMVQLVGLMYRAGIPVEAGTDSMAGFALHRELELDVEAGIPAPEVLKLATLGAARIMSRDGDLGSIAPGKLADLVLIDGNPAEKITDVRKTALVVKDGAVYKPAELYRELGIRP